MRFKRLMILLPVAALLLATLLTLNLLPAAQPASAAPTAQQASPICFPGVPGIADCVDGRFAGYWRGNGGLPVFGYPISPVAAAAGTPAPGTPASSQWTERNRLELHPANRAPYDVQIGRVGAERLEQLGRDHWADGGEPGPQAGCLWFPETRHNVCDQGRGAGFKSYWEANGLRLPGLNAYQRSLALFGLPLTAANPEPGPDGELVVTQWFERARMEWRPGQPARFRVQLGLLGRELRAGGAGGPSTAPAPAPAPAVREGTPQIVGVEISGGNVARVAERLNELRPAWVRYNGISWDQVEPRRGERRWAQLSGVEQELAAISATGASPMVIVRGAPGWAQAERGKVCGPVSSAALPAFASFMGELVARYSKPPYNVKHWEIGNEPDAPFDLLAGSEPFGCWGDTRQPDYNGDAYAAALKAIYPAMKAADPDANIVFGGLLLDCDPGLANQARPCGQGKFLDGVLAAGGGDYFDILAYHSYIYWGPVTQDWDQNFPNWKHRGSVMLGKLAFLQETLAKYGLKKPVIMNEGGMLCYRSDPSCGPQGFYEAQANHAVRMYTRAWAAGLEGAIWYTFEGPGWQDGGMLDAAQQPRPAYRATLFLSRLLSGASYVEKVSDGPLEGYRFQKGDTRYLVVWTNDGSARELPLPQGTRSLYSLVGEPRAPGTALAVGFEPVIVESAP